MTLLSDILACPQYKPLARDDGAIAAALSVGRTKIIPFPIGKGAVLSALGIAGGNALLDIIDSQSEFRHVKQLVEFGWLDIGNPLTRSMVTSMVGTVLTQEQATLLLNLAIAPDPVTAIDVAKALEGI